MSSLQNTLCISEAYSSSPNVPAETMHRYISDIQATMVRPRNLPKDPLERLTAILDEALEIIGDEEYTMRPIR
jgi:NaMN:DMB phosphoribosyltransferase